MLGLILWWALSGLIVGLLGRLLVPGPNPIGILGTIGVGLLGAFIGGVAAGLIWPKPGQHLLGVFILEVLGAALIVALVSRTRRRRNYV